jgi:RHS repeat-associated protein
LTDNSGNVLARYAYDPWGKRVGAANWAYSPTYTSTLNIDRGYTMHEHLDEFDLINMNGRVYDPAVAQFLSPDPYIQDAGNWLNYNRYAYCYNNPTRYTDPSGEIIKTFLTDFFTTLFTGGLNFGNKELQKNAWRKFDPSAPWSKTNKAIRIAGGLFKTDSNLDFWGRSRQLISRFTWEKLQTFVGYEYAIISNMFGFVDRVDFYGGATFVTNENATDGWGISFGTYIGVSLRSSYINRPFEEYITYNTTYMHEYGHYLQSQMLGAGYLFTIGAYSLAQTWINSGKYVDYKGYSVPKSRFAWTEVWANIESGRYFGKYEGVDWSNFDIGHPRTFNLF